MKRKLIAKTFAGLEDVLAKELEQIGADDIETGIRMVSFSGDKQMLYRANFCLRTAVKVLMPICEFKATDADEVYEHVKRIDWNQYLDTDMTFLVDAVIFSEQFRHSRFAAYRVKDAIADYFRERTGRRPNVGISNPDLRINLHIAENTVTISLDSSGESLHHRGYRTGSVTAPINEVLAAGMIRLTGWDGESDFYDPMCGSGTIAIEAALIARNIYPGVFRREFAFERWKDFDPDMFDAIYNDDSQEREFAHHIYASDINHHAVAIATENTKSAGVADIVTVVQRDIRDLEQPTEPAIMVTNPPYGERITSDDILNLYADIGSTLKHSFVGNDAWILSLHDECFARIGFQASTRYILYNGALDCEFRKYQVFEGRLSERRSEGMELKTQEERLRNKQFKGHKQRPQQRDDEQFERPEEGTAAAIDAETVSRHNFKWGDRSTNFRSDADDHYFRSRPFRKPYDKKGDKAEGRPSRHSDDRSSRNFDDKPRKPFGRPGKPSVKSDNPFERSAKSYGKAGKSADKSDRPKRPRFDADGRPIKE